MFAKLKLILDNKKKSVLYLFAILIILIIGVIDYLTGSEISLSIFYLFPIMLITWSLNQHAGILFSVLSGILWFLADIFTGHLYSHPSIPYWNTLVRLGFFSITVIILTKLKSAYINQKNLARKDVLTNILNGRAFLEFAEFELERFKRFNHPLSIAY